MAGTSPTPAAHGAAADRAETLELYLADKRQLFNSMDPAPFRERDLDPQAEAYIVDWARERSPSAPLGLEVHLGREAPGSQDEALVRDAVHEYFRRRALASRSALRQLLRTGRISLVIGIAFLAVAIALAQFVGSLIDSEGTAWLVSESLIIGGWVALWRPMEIFLYDWWPIRAEARLHERLSAMEVRLRGVSGGAA